MLALVFGCAGMPADRQQIEAAVGPPMVDRPRPRSLWRSATCAQARPACLRTAGTARMFNKSGSAPARAMIEAAFDWINRRFYRR